MFSSNRKVTGSKPRLPVKVSLSKILNPKIAPDEQVGTLNGTLCYQCMNVCEWVNLISVVKCIEWSVKWKSVEMQVY